MSQSDLVEARNVDIDDTGGLSRRQGYSLTLAGSDCHSLWSTADGSVTLLVQGDALHRFDGQALAQLGSGLTIGARMRYVEHLGRVYHTNGIESGVYEAGVVRGWGLAVPAAPVLAATGGDLRPGRYAVTITSVAADGQESGAGPGTEIELAVGGGIVVSIPPTTNPRIVARRVYCTTANGATFYLAGAADAGTFTIAGSQNNLQRPLTLLHAGRPPAGMTHLAYHHGRIYASVGARLHYSMPFSLELFQPTDYIDLGSRIRMIAPVEGGLFVGDEAGVHWLPGGNPAAMSMARVAGRAVEDTLVFAPAGVLGAQSEMPIPVWLSEDGPAVGMPDGSVRLPNARKFRFESPDRGAALFRRMGETFQYLSTL